MALAAAAVGEAFLACGVAAGDLVMLHADASVAAQLPPMPVAERLDQVLDAVRGVLGLAGTLVLPSFTYSFTRGEAFDPRTSPSIGMGLLAERFRQSPGVRRSRHPLFSVAASGALAEAFASVPVDDCFGTGSAFDLLVRHDGWIACLACALDRATFVHHVEQRAGVGYRYFKNFAGRIDDAAGSEMVTCRYLVRDLARASETDLGRLRRRLEQLGRLRHVAVGRVPLIAVRARDFLAVATGLLAEDPAALIREGAA